MTKKHQSVEKNNHDVLDAYESFFSRFNIEYSELIDFALDETIFVEFEPAKKNWDDIKRNIENKEEMHIRNYARNGEKNYLYVDFYKCVFGLNVAFDKSNNTRPQKKIGDMTGKRRGRDIINYQVAHVFSRTKNIYLFEASWNIMYAPKYIDPFTGHEAQGNWGQQYTDKLHAKVYCMYKDMIEDYNRIVSDQRFKDEIEKYLNSIQVNKPETETVVVNFRRSVRENFAPIPVVSD